LVLIIVVLVIVLPIIFVAIPKKAQKDINASTIEVTAQDVTNPTTDGIHLKLVSLAKSGSKFHPTLEAFTAGLSLEGQEPFLFIDVPETKAEAETEIVVEEDLKFTTAEAFSRYTMTVMGSEEFTVHMDGKTKVHLSGLPSMSVDYNKKVTMKGLNHLKGLNIYDLEILAGEDALEDGSNMIGTVYIPNPSVMLLELGNVTMNLAVDDDPIGYALIPNLTLRPGNNTIPMQAHVESLKVIGVITNKYKNGIIPLQITGNSSVYNGQHLEYYEAAIKSNLIKLDLDVGPALSSLGIEI
jgi:hypothetical protein